MKMDTFSVKKGQQCGQRTEVGPGVTISGKKDVIYELPLPPSIANKPAKHSAML